MNSDPDAPGAGPHSFAQGQLRVRDFLERASVTLDSREDNLSLEDTLLAGQFQHMELREGLFLHLSDAEEEHDFTATSVLREGLSCVFFLDGEIDLTVGDRQFAFKGDPRGAIEGVAIVNAGPDRFQRMSRGRQHVRHLVISASPEWLDFQGLEAIGDTTKPTALFKNHLASHRWTLPPHAVSLVQQIFSPSPFTPALQRLYLEGRAVDLVAETIAAAAQAERRRASGGILTGREMNLLDRAKALIDARLMSDLSVETIARATGLSTSGLQRLFRLAERCSVFDYVRQRRLRRAFEILQNEGASVQEAAATAGYAHPANFATAFKRQFGITPRALSTARRR
ncbi:helix-turn-helix transcriptional regulator [Nitratireductor soli]|uniref:helix-turn-helix transcriptional regulator n=1 Tax=Nitratireductor soli TaxID=1670619 RepID=UPI00065E8420|nr:AraC family transcriptional regulator [Nitratireductor soli]